MGYIPSEAEVANLFFQLISARYERASVIMTSTKPFGRAGEMFRDATVAAAMIDRLVHPATVVSLKGDNYRLKDRWRGTDPAQAAVEAVSETRTVADDRRICLSSTSTARAVC